MSSMDNLDISSQDDLICNNQKDKITNNFTKFDPKYKQKLNISKKEIFGHIENGEKSLEKKRGFKYKSILLQARPQHY